MGYVTRNLRETKVGNIAATRSAILTDLNLNQFETKKFFFPFFEKADEMALTHQTPTLIERPLAIFLLANKQKIGWLPLNCFKK